MQEDTKSKNNKGSQQQNLSKVLDLLEIMATSSKAMTISEISKALNITRATAYSIVKLLIAKNYIEKTEDDNKYSIGYKFYQIGSLYPMKHMYVKAAEKHVEHMSKKWELKINVGTLKPPYVVVILLTMDTSLIPKMVYGHVMPSHASSLGKLLLAYQDPKEVKAYFEEIELRKYAPKTITDVSNLMDELDKIKEQGYSLELEELSVRHACVSAPIRDMSGDVIAGVSFSCSLEQYERDKEGLIEDVMILGQTISAELGYSPMFL